MRDDLQRLSAQFAYFRAIGLTYDKRIYCSSLFAHNALDISDVIIMPLPAKLPPPVASPSIRSKMPTSAQRSFLLARQTMAGALLAWLMRNI
ncbi:MAG: CSS-motif domain-containing protein [Symbiopectobacterium sp.]